MTLPLGTPPGTYFPTLMVHEGDRTFETLHLAPLLVTRPLSTPPISALELVTPTNSTANTVHDGLSLVGVGFDQPIATPCQNWSLSLAWRAEAPPAQDYDLRLSAGAHQVEMPLVADYSTAHWQPGDVWRTRHHVLISCRAMDGTVPVVAQLLDANGSPAGDALDLGEVTVVAGRQFTLPDDVTSTVNVQLSAVGALVGYQLDRERVKPGENLKVTLYWRAGRETDQNYSVFTHLQSDRVWAQHDGWPAGGQKATSTWAQDEIITDEHIIQVAEDVPPGTYRLVVGMYDAATLQSLGANEPGGEPITDGRIVLQSIIIDNP
jgi:hypothetical protein